MEEDTTPKASPIVAFPQAQPVEIGPIISSVPTHSLGSSMHAPGNEMVNDSNSTSHLSLSQQMDEMFDSMMEIFFKTLDNWLQPLIADVQRLSNIVDGRTPPRHVTSAKPPPPNIIPPLPTQTPRGQAGQIAPTFVQVTIAQMLKQQDSVKGFRVVASKAQNRKESGMPQRGNAISQAGTMEVTVIHFGGLENRDEEASLLRQHPSSFVEAAQRALNRLSKHAPPTILKGRWSSTSDRTGNFVYTLLGTYPPDIIDNIKAPLCSPFKGPSTLVLANSWTWAQLRQVPNKDEDSAVTYNVDDLMRALTANPCFQSIFIPVPPSWIGNLENFSTPTASVSFAYVEQDKAITQRATLEGVCMFGHQVQFVHCRDKAIIVQCSCCHSMEHFAKKCPVPTGEVHCPKCNGNHELKEHDYECPGNHRVPGKCDCTFKCILCKQTGHHA